MEQERQLARGETFTPTTMPFEEMERVAKYAAESGMFGITKPAQAMCLFAICQSEGIHYMKALQKYHLIEGRPSMKADYMLGEFLAKKGLVIWHVRTDDMVAATFGAPDCAAEFHDRAIQRFNLLWSLDTEEDAVERSKIMIEIAKVSAEGEETIIRTLADAQEKHLSDSYKDGQWKTKHNWKQSPRQMLTARVITEGVGLIDPGLRAGIYTADEIQDTVQAEAQDRDVFIERALRNPDPRDRESIQRMIDQYLEEAKTAKPARKSELQGLASELRVKLQDMDLEQDEIPGIAQATKSELPPAAEAELQLDGEHVKEIPWQDYVLQHVKSKTLLGKKLGSFKRDDITVIYEKTKNALDSPDPKIRSETHYIELAYKATNLTEEK